ncbi:hypothetical protein [Stackebrandtia soli]|uniref:hypothetical protein n=1 Tax=Stackebrandtia soli TaxID=1892856 RepID=UPI0039E8940F
MTRTHLVAVAITATLLLSACGGDEPEATDEASPSQSTSDEPRTIGGGDVPVTFDIPGNWKDFDSTSGDMQDQLAEADLPDELQSLVEMAVAQLGDTPLLYALDPRPKGDFATNVNAYCGTGEEDDSLTAIQKAAESGFKSMDATDVESEPIAIRGDAEAVQTTYKLAQEGAELAGTQYGIPVDGQFCYVTMTTDDTAAYDAVAVLLRDSLSVG